MSGPFRLIHEHPQPVAVDLATTSRESALVALDIQCKYQFVDKTGAVFHEYVIPGSADIHNCGGYVDKVLQYRDPSLLAHLQEKGVSAVSCSDPDFPLLVTRSPQLDLLLLALIQHLLSAGQSERVSILDHGCTVGEHWDLLDVMLRAAADKRAADVLTYCGIDRSPLVLATARALHADVQPEHFRLILAEGSEFDVPNGAFDLSLSVGVVNHVADPMAGLGRLLDATRHAAVLALWVTSEEEGFWALNHSGVGNYFFSRRDLAKLQHGRTGGRFLVADFIPEGMSSQGRSYIGIDEEKERSLGCYHLVYTTLDPAPLPFDALAL
jgi:SAM-dependent methyltransferase